MAREEIKQRRQEQTQQQRPRRLENPHRRITLMHDQQETSPKEYRMSRVAAVTAIICGTICILAPWLYSMYRMRVMTGLLREGATAVNLEAVPDAMYWVTSLVGILLLLKAFSRKHEA